MRGDEALGFTGNGGGQLLDDERLFGPIGANAGAWPRSGGAEHGRERGV